MKLCVWTLTNDTSYNKRRITKHSFGHRFELELNIESRLITEGAVCGHPGIYMMIIYTTFLVCGHSEIYMMILYTTFRYRVSG